MSGEIDPPKTGDDPIDAQFEPAPPAADYVAKPEKVEGGPGWTALGLTGLAATVLGGLIGAGIGNTAGSSAFAPETLVSDVQEVAEDQVDQEKRLAGMIESLDGRVSREIATVAAARGDDGAIKTLADEIEALNERLEALDVADQEAGEASVWDAGAMIARIEALETADDDDVTSPRIANRVITALRSRVEAMEAEAEARADAVSALTERLDALEEGGVGNGGGISEEALADLREEVASLKEAAANLTEEDVEQNAEDRARLNRWVEELREKEQRSQTTINETRGATSAAFAMLSLDAAVRDGRPFQSAYAQLEDALPGNRSVARLRPLSTKGVTTMSALQSQFEAAKEDAANTATISEASGEDEGWSWVRKAFGDSVTVRRKDQPDDGFEAAMRTAQSALARRDLGAAVTAVESVEGARGEAFADWLVNAKDRKTLEDALDEVRLTLMTTER